MGSEDEKETGGKEGKTLTLVFGRFNPPTIGHKKLLDSARQVAGDGDMRVYPSRSNDPKKNPLEPGQKTELMRKMFPDHILMDIQM
jgi:nicotinic acid mononucleotide adenylyltransferase